MFSKDIEIKERVLIAYILKPVIFRANNDLGSAQTSINHLKLCPSLESYLWIMVSVDQVYYCSLQQLLLPEQRISKSHGKGVVFFISFGCFKEHLLKNKTTRTL